MDSPINIYSLLRKRQVTPRKSLGQNFLFDATILRRIVECADVSSTDLVLEIGAGAGSLTRCLAATAREVIAVELDQDLVGILTEVLAGFPNIKIVHGDILKMNPNDLVGEAGYLVVANIPYFITSALIRHLLEAPLKPARLVLTIQKEVAERICAKPGDLSLLALSVQVYGMPRVVLRIPSSAFYPQPKVDSATLRVDLYPQPLIPGHLLVSFFRLAKAGFSQKRKTLRNALSGGLSLAPERVTALLDKAGIDAMRRAQSLSLEEWKTLTEVFYQLK